jgi:hypothetical protein
LSKLFARVSIDMVVPRTNSTLFPTKPSSESQIESPVAQVVGEKGPVVAATAIFPMLALLLIFAMIPETRGLELEDTSALEAD